MRIIDRYQAILLDAQKTFVFGGDRFGPEEDFHATYKSLGGRRLGAEAVNRAVRDCVDWLWERYNDPAYFENYPSLRQGFLAACPGLDPAGDWEILERAFALHERGLVPEEYARCLQTLAETHRLGVVSNIWARKDAWVEDFRDKGVHDLFEVLVFSSDLCAIKPAPAPFEQALAVLDLPPSEVLFVGDNPVCDIAGAKAAGMDAALTLNHGPRPEGLNPEPDYVVASLLDLLHARA